MRTLKALHKQRGCGGCYNLKLLVESHKNYIDYMKKTGVFYGSLTGVTAAIARRIAAKLGVSDDDVHDVAKTAPSVLGDYEIDILGSSTWGSGEPERDWLDFLDGADGLDLKGHKIAVFGCGDETMSDTFCNAVGEIYRRMQPTGAEFIAQFDADGYDFDRSGAEVDGRFVGLVLDEVNKPELTDGRIAAWADIIKKY